MKNSLIEINKDLKSLNKNFEKMNRKVEEHEGYKKSFKYMMKLFIGG